MSEWLLTFFLVASLRRAGDVSRSALPPAGWLWALVGLAGLLAVEWLVGSGGGRSGGRGSGRSPAGAGVCFRLVLRLLPSWRARFPSIPSAPSLLNVHRHDSAMLAG